MDDSRERLQTLHSKLGDPSDFARTINCTTPKKPEPKPSKMDEEKQNLTYTDIKGWVKVNDHLTLVECDLQNHTLFPMGSSNKAFCGRISAEAAIMKRELEVLIR